MKSEIELKPADNRLFKPRFEFGVRLPLLILALVVTFFVLQGCAKAPDTVYRTVYQDVYIPVACDYPLPIKPLPTDSAVVNTIDILHYTRELEITLKACRGE